MGSFALHYTIFLLCQELFCKIIDNYAIVYMYDHSRLKINAIGALLSRVAPSAAGVQGAG